MSETLGCGHPDKNRACGDCLDEAEAEVHRLELQVDANAKEILTRNQRIEQLQRMLADRASEVDAANRLNGELAEALKAFLAADNGGWEIRHAAENTYCPDCANDSDSWRDQTEHHAGCKYLARIEAAKAALSKVTPSEKRTDVIRCPSCGVTFNLSDAEEKRNHEGDGHICIAAEGVPCSLCGRVAKEGPYLRDCSGHIGPDNAPCLKCGQIIR